MTMLLNLTLPPALYGTYWNDIYVVDELIHLANIFLMIMKGPSLMAVWSKALPLTTSYLSPLSLIWLSTWLFSRSSILIIGKSSLRLYMVENLTIIEIMK